MSKAKATIRAGDLVEVVVPTVVTRVGYPKAIDEYLGEVEKNFGDQIRRLFPAVFRHKIDRLKGELAYCFAKSDGFGGKLRSLHTAEEPRLLGRSFTVYSVRTVNTGTYYPSSSSRSYYGEVDWEPGGLMNQKPHRLATISFDWKEIEVQVAHLRKLKAGSL